MSPLGGVESADPNNRLRRSASYARASEALALASSIYDDVFDTDSRGELLAAAGSILEKLVVLEAFAKEQQQLAVLTYVDAVRSALNACQANQSTFTRARIDVVNRMVGLINVVDDLLEIVGHDPVTTLYDEPHFVLRSTEALARAIEDELPIALIVLVAHGDGGRIADVLRSQGVDLSRLFPSDRFDQSATFVAALSDCTYGVFFANVHRDVVTTYIRNTNAALSEVVSSPVTYGVEIDAKPSASLYSYLAKAHATLAPLKRDRRRQTRPQIRRTHADGSTFVGTIVGSSETVVRQDVGRGLIVEHHRHAIAGEVKLGRIVRIDYEDGKAIIRSQV